MLVLMLAVLAVMLLTLVDTPSELAMMLALLLLMHEVLVDMLDEI